MKTKRHYTYYLFVASLFLIISAPQLFSEGMVMDGTLYATMARNLADGVGSFWAPHMSNELLPEFHHPPLAIVLQSIGFKVFGDNLLVERFYGLLMLVTVGWLIILLWKEFTNTYKNAWVPLLIYFTISKVSWACANNMMENTLLVFICASAYFLLKKNINKNVGLFISGLFLALAVLTKGFIPLFIWGIPFFIWLLKRNDSFWRVITHTILLIIATLIPFLIIYAINPSVIDIWSIYLNDKVIATVQNSKTVPTRLFIIIAVIYHFTPTIIISLILFLFAKNKKDLVVKVKQSYKLPTSILLIALSGILPILISQKQGGHYALGTYPFIAIGIALIIQPIIQPYIEKLGGTKYAFKIFYITTICLFIASITISVISTKKIGREKEMVLDCKTIIKTIGRDCTIGIQPDLEKQWYIHAYFARYANISIDSKGKSTYKYFITPKTSNYNKQKEYELESIKTLKYSLYKNTPIKSSR